MSTLDPSQILKQRPKRTLYRENHPEWGPVIVKRFHAPTWWQRLGDRQRAQREERSLIEWKGMGLPVPAPPRTRRKVGHWELVLPEVPGARNLIECLRDPKALPISIRELARRTGAVLAQLDLSGAVQGDLHPGNLLFDAEGNPWLIDPTPTPLFSSRAEQGWARWVALGGQVRDLSRPSFRAAVWRAYRAHQGPAPGPQTAAEGMRLEEEARLWRVRESEQRSLRWFRESGATEIRSCSYAVRSPTVSSPYAGTERTTAYADLDSSDHVWGTYAWLTELRLPVVAPIRRPFALEFSIESLLPEGWAPCASPPPPELAGHQLGLWHDRALVAPAPNWTAFGKGPQTGLLFDPERLPEPTISESPWHEPPRHPLWEPYTRSSADWTRFCHAFVRAQNGPPEVRTRLAQWLCQHG